MTDILPDAGPGARASVHTLRVMELCVRAHGVWDRIHGVPGELGFCDYCLTELRQDQP
jgi:hypothetical protein